MRSWLFAPTVRRALFFFLVSFFSLQITSAQNLPNAPSAQKATVKTAQKGESDWPRTMTSGTDTFLVYQPQVDKWEGNRH